MQLTQHPLSAAFPALPPADFAALIEDIKAHGQRDPIILLGNEVLDGWNRYKACEAIGVKPKSKKFDGKDPVSFVISHNLHRRHLDASQRAASVLEARAWQPSLAPTGGGAIIASPLSNTALAKEAKVSVRTIQNAKRATEAGLNEHVKAGEITADRGAEIAKLPEEERAAAVKTPKEKKKAKARVEKNTVKTTPTDGRDERIAKLDERLQETIEANERGSKEIERLTALVDSSPEELVKRLGRCQATLRSVEITRDNAITQGNLHLKDAKGLQRDLNRVTKELEALKAEHAKCKK